MRKVKSTALLSAFVAVASLGVISHEAHGTKLSSLPNYIAREALNSTQNLVSLSGPVVTPSVNYPSGATVTLTLGGASFYGNASSYTIISGNTTYCTGKSFSSNSTILSLSCSNGLVENNSYTIVGGNSSSTLPLEVPQTTGSIVLSYSSNVNNDTPSSVTLAQVIPQLTVKPANAVTATIDPNSLSTFTASGNASSSTAYNTITISSSNPSTFSDPITSDTLYVTFNGIPSSVSTISATFLSTTTSDTATSNYTQGAGSATVSLVLLGSGGNTDAVFNPPYSNTATFNFVNSGTIQPGTISISSIISADGTYSYSLSSTSFLSFSLPATQLYIPDALVSDSNVIQYSYLTISMPSSASIASISALNTGVSCSVSSISLTSTSTNGVYYMDLSQLVQACPGISSVAWQSGVPLVITIANATTSQVTADAYAVFGGMLKRIPVNVINGNGSNNFSY